MKKSVKIVLIIISVLLGMLLLFKGVDVMMLRTDSGWDSSYDSGGWDSDWDSGGWDSDYDYDYDWDSSDSSISGTASAYLMIIFFIVWVFIIGYSIYKSIGATKSAIKQYSNVPTLNAEQKEKNARRVEELTGIHPETLKNELFEIYKNIQVAWMDFDYDKLRTLCNDEIYNTYKTQLEALNLKGQKNIMENFNLTDIYFLSPYAQKDVVVITVILKVSQNDYVVNIKDNNVEHGDSDRILDMTYKLVYEFRKVQTDKCPNCNAKIKPETSKCDYCNSVIIQGKGKFVLVRKEALDQN